MIAALNTYVSNFIDHCRGLTAERGSKLTGAQLLRYEIAKHYAVGKDILDVGCGLGEGAYLIACDGAKSVTGTDAAAVAIDYAKKHYTFPGLKYFMTSIIDLQNIRRKYDLITCFEVIEHIRKEEYPSLLDTVAKLLNDNGLFIISTPNKLITSPRSTKPHNPFHIHEFKPQEFESLLLQYFKKVDMNGIICINNSYLRHVKETKHTHRRGVIQAVCSYKLTHRILPLVPQRIKNAFNPEGEYVPNKTEDFRLTKKSVETCDDLYVFCKMT